MTPQEVIEAFIYQGCGGGSVIAAEVIEALDAAGYIIVPKEPTEAMIAAYYGGTGIDAGDVDGVDIRAVWRAMTGAK